MFVTYRNQKTRSSNLRRMEALQPGLFDLANTLGMRLHWRGGVMWGNDVQLTFEKRKMENGDAVDMSEVERAECALTLLRKIAKARSEWPSLLDRANRMIDRFVAEVVEPRKLRTMCFSVCSDDSLDSCWTFGGPRLGLQDEPEVGLHLIGEHGVIGRGKTLNEAIADLRAKAEKEFKDKQPSGIATKPFDGDSQLEVLQSAIVD